MSPLQRAVLSWLAAYPGVEIGWEPGGNRPSWTMAWASEEARLHMVGVMDFLGGDARDSAPRLYPRGGTPRLITPTFEVLVRRRYVRAVKHRPANGVWAAMTYWQISLDGLRALNPALTLVRGDLAVSA